MSLTSGDKAFGTIAKQKGFVTADVLSAKEDELSAKRASGEDVSLADFLVAQYLLDAKKRAEVERVRARHGRTCAACSKETFLLPGQLEAKTVCEFCGGKLRPKGAGPGAVEVPTSTPTDTTRPVEVPTSRPRVAIHPVEVPTSNPRVDTPPREVPTSTPRVAIRPVEVPTSNRPDATRGREVPTSNHPEPNRRVEVPTSNEGAPAGSLVQKPKTPLVAEVAQILGAPVRGTGALFITLGSFLLAASGYMTTHNLFPYSLFVAAGCALVFVYVNAYVLKTANASTAGSLDLPDWPDWEEAVGSSWPWDETGSLGFRLLLVQLACFWPFLFCLLAVALPSARRGSAVKTVGEFAGQMAGKNDRVGRSVADELLYDRKDEPWRIGDRKGRWLVMALLEKETGDDTGMDRALRALPKMLPGASYTPGNQTFDLERVARALPEVDMAGVFIDPGLRYMRMYGLVPREKTTRPGPAPQETPSGEDQLEGAETGPDGQRRPPLDVNKLPLIGQAAKLPEAGKVIEGVSLVLRTHEAVMPGALANAHAQVPTIWIVNPAGVVRREFEGGSSDKQLYATLKDFMAGGNGEVDAELLPLRAYGLEEPVVLDWLAQLLFVLGVVYYPIALLICTVFTSGFLAFRYPVGIVAIAKTAKDYFLLVALFGVMLALASGLSFGLSIALRNHGAVVGAGLAVWVKAWLELYASLVIAVGVGRFYVRHARELNWLSVEETAGSFDATTWKPDRAPPGPFEDAAASEVVGSSYVAPPSVPRAKTFGPPGFEAREGAEPATFAPARPRLEAGGGPAPLKALSVLNAVPRWVEVVIAVLGIAVGSWAVKSEMRLWSFDAVAGDQIGKLNRMSVDVKGELLSELKKEGFAVAPDEIQLMYLVKYKADGELDGTPQAFVTVRSPSTGYYHQCRNLTRTAGRGGFELTQDESKIWPAPKGQDRVRSFLIFAGFIVGGLFLAKALLVSRD